jgi:hypothetical protein
MISVILPVIFACDYAFMGMPTTSVEVYINADGTPASSVQVTVQGRSHKESATPEVVAADEDVHLWISKESAENSIEMVIYKEAKAEGLSKLVNHHVPIGQEMWGNCTTKANPED